MKLRRRRFLHLAAGALALPAVSRGGDPMPLTPDAFGNLVADETQKWAKVIRGANIHLE